MTSGSYGRGLRLSLSPVRPLNILTLACPFRVYVSGSHPHRPEGNRPWELAVAAWTEIEAGAGAGGSAWKGVEVRRVRSETMGRPQPETGK